LFEDALAPKPFAPLPPLPFDQFGCGVPQFPVANVHWSACHFVRDLPGPMAAHLVVDSFWQFQNWVLEIALKI
jgi:hypothetical protein